MKRVAIIGAGVAGLAAARAFRETDFEVFVFEKSRGLGGRAATRGRGGVRYDHGANYFCADSDRVRSLVYSELPTADLIQITAPVRPLSNVAPDPAPPPRRLNYRHGISQLAKLLAADSRATVLQEARVERLQRAGLRWRLLAEGGRMFQDFDAVLLTAPAPQSAVIVEASDMEGPLRYTLSKSLRRARYESQICLVLGFDEAGGLDVDWYAQVDTERRQSIAWMAMEHAKTGHVPPGETVLLVQMAPEWSTRHYLDPFEALLPEVLAQVRQVLPSLPPPTWHDGQRWRFARATTPADVDALAAGHAQGLFFAGDAIASRSRVERAIETGLDAAADIVRMLGGD